MRKLIVTSVALFAFLVSFSTFTSANKLVKECSDKCEKQFKCETALITYCNIYLTKCKKVDSNAKCARDHKRCLADGLSRGQVRVPCCAKDKNTKARRNALRQCVSKRNRCQSECQKTTVKETKEQANKKRADLRASSCRVANCSSNQKCVARVKKGKALKGECVCKNACLKVSGSRCVAVCASNQKCTTKQKCVNVLGNVLNFNGGTVCSTQIFCNGRLTQ